MLTMETNMELMGLGPILSIIMVKMEDNQGSDLMQYTRKRAQMRDQENNALGFKNNIGPYAIKKNY